MKQRTKRIKLTRNCLFGLLTFSFILSACRGDEIETPNSGKNFHQINISFRPQYNGDIIAMNDLRFTNAAGNEHSISRLRFAISRLSLERANYGEYTDNGFHLVWIEPDADRPFPNNESLRYTLPNNLKETTLYDLSFNFGFQEDDNVVGRFPGLSAIDWDWPQRLGGGYHYLQMDGKYKTDNDSLKPYDLYMGKARDTTGANTRYENNHFRVNFDLDSVKLNRDINIEVIVNLEQLFKEPDTLDLDQLPKKMRGHFPTQEKLEANGRNGLFEIGLIE